PSPGSCSPPFPPCCAPPASGGGSPAVRTFGCGSRSAATADGAHDPHPGGIPHPCHVRGPAGVDRAGAAGRPGRRRTGKDHAMDAPAPPPSPPPTPPRHDPDELARALERERPRLVALASRVLGDPAEAQDIVQQAWLRLAAA